MLRGVFAQAIVGAIMVFGAMGITVSQELSSVNWLDLGSKYGPLGIIVAWFLYRDYKREQSMSKRINHLTDNIFESTLRSQAKLTEAINARPCILLRQLPGDNELIKRMEIQNHNQGEDQNG